MKRKFLSVLLALSMALTLLPAAVSPLFSSLFNSLTVSCMLYRSNTKKSPRSIFFNNLPAVPPAAAQAIREKNRFSCDTSEVVRNC